jgi:hypothetical protein
MSTKSMLKGALLSVTCVSLAGPVLAVDPYEAVQHFAQSGDDTNASNVTLTTGVPQTHDLDQASGFEDRDWMVVPTIAHHSYEARISASSIAWDHGACGTCAQIERVDASGAVLTEPVAIVNDGSGGTSYDKSVRWIATSSTVAEFLRVSGGTAFTENASSVYTVRFWDTTYAIPRWNNVSGQVTVFVISSLIQAPATVRIDFYSAPGALLGSQSFTLDANQLIVFNTGTLPALAGQSGHAYVVHTAGYGGLAGKAVALEAATGFSFDTPMVPIPN